MIIDTIYKDNIEISPVYNIIYRIVIHKNDDSIPVRI